MDIAKIRKSLVLEALAGAYLLTVVVLFWRQPIITTLLLASGLGYCLWHYRSGADVAAMVAAALLGTPAEMICVKYGIWTYDAPGLFLGIPIWIPLIWASLFCLFRRITLTLLGLADLLWFKPQSLARRALFIFIGAIILAYFCVLAATISRTIIMVYSVILLIGVIFWHKERDILIFVIGGILGTLGEYICMQIGFWQYHFPYLKSVGLPISLPMAWGVSAVMIGRIAKIWEVEPDKS
jgi:hypothetical protein